MNPVPAPSYYTFGRQALAKRFAVLLKEIDNVRARKSVDSIHDIRVASRRFHAAAQIFSDCLSAQELRECERAVRWIRKSAGAVRDCDVQKLSVERIIAATAVTRHHAGMQRLIVRLTQKRDKKLPRLISAINSFGKKSVPGKMHRALSMPLPKIRQPLTLRQRAARDIVTLLGSFLEFEEYVYQSTASTELHTMRIAAKRLRYVLEIYNPLYSSRLKPYIAAVRSIQTHLGDLHDCDVWLQKLPSFTEKERKRTLQYFGDTAAFHRIERGILYLIEQLRKERTSHYHAFLRTWKRIQKEEMWNKLSSLVTVQQQRVKTGIALRLTHIQGKAL